MGYEKRRKIASFRILVSDPARRVAEFEPHTNLRGELSGLEALILVDWWGPRPALTLTPNP